MLCCPIWQGRIASKIHTLKNLLGYPERNMAFRYYHAQRIPTQPRWADDISCRSFSTTTSKRFLLRSGSLLWPVYPSLPILDREIRTEELDQKCHLHPL